MFKVFGTATYYSENTESDMQTKGEYDENVKIKVSITGRDAFDEVTQVLNAMDILNMIQKFNPETKIPPAIITKLMGVTNEIADEIQEELDKQEDPDLQIAEGQAKKLIQGIPQNANENDNHQVFIAIFSEALKNVPPDSPAADAIISAIKMHEAFLSTSQPQ
jgi:galactitol-specific phosphotransferase system IIB component